MRTRMIRGLAAAAVAGATLTFCPGAAGTASASATGRPAGAAPVLGPAVYTKDMAGYEAAGGRYFRYIQSLITVPDWRPNNLQPHEYIQLAGVDQWVRLGITFRGGR